MSNRTGKKISTNVLLLSAVSFLNDLSSEIIMPVLPMFLESLGAGGKVIGLVGGLRDGISNILKVFCGYWSDKTGKRRIFLYSGYFISIIFKLLLAVSRIWQSAVVFSCLERVGKGLRTAARDAVIAESMASERGRAFGIHRSLETVGAILGATAAFGLFWFLKLEFRSIILIAGIIGFAALVPIGFVSGSEARPQKITLKLGIAGLPVRLKLFILVSSVFALGNFSYMFFVMKAQGIFAGRLSVAAPILLYVLFNVVYSALAVPLGSISDRIGREKVIIFGYICFSVTAAGFAFLSSLTAYMALFALYGVVHAAIDGNQRAYVADLACEHLKATAIGTFHTATGLAAIPGGLLAGFLWERLSPQATFVYGGVMALVSVLLFVVFNHFADRSNVEACQKT
ncbi:MAG TPA: MFS transporter [Sedimentisphaerales bacterium]|nr:MFS transporter [Sedimentisphaerales bacterium]